MCRRTVHLAPECLYIHSCKRRGRILEQRRILYQEVARAKVVGMDENFSTSSHDRNHRDAQNQSPPSPTHCAFFPFPLPCSSAFLPCNAFPSGVSNQSIPLRIPSSMPVNGLYPNLVFAFSILNVRYAQLGLTFCLVNIGCLVPKNTIQYIHSSSVAITSATFLGITHRSFSVDVSPAARHTRCAKSQKCQGSSFVTKKASPSTRWEGRSGVAEVEALRRCAAART